MRLSPQMSIAPVGAAAMDIGEVPRDGGTGCRDFSQA